MRASVHLHSVFMLGDHSLDHVAGHIRQTEIAPIVTIGEFGVVKSQQRQDGRVQIMDMHLVLNRTRAKFIRCAVNRPALYSAARPSRC